MVFIFSFSLSLHFKLLHSYRFLRCVEVRLKILSRNILSSKAYRNKSSKQVKTPKQKQSEVVQTPTIIVIYT